MVLFFERFFKKFAKEEKGFTLVELMIVIAIIGILSVVLVPKIGRSKDAAKDSGVGTNVRAIQAELEIMNLSQYAITNQAAVDTVVADINTRLTALNVKNPYTASSLILKPGDSTYATETNFAVKILSMTYTTPPDRATVYNNYKSGTTNNGFVANVVGGVYVALNMNDGKLEAGIYDMGNKVPLTTSVDKIVRVGQ